MLQESQTYQLSHFGVGSNVGSFKTTKHEYSLNFEHGTDVKSLKSFNSLRYGFSFVIDNIGKECDTFYLVGNKIKLQFYF